MNNPLDDFGFGFTDDDREDMEAHRAAVEAHRKAERIAYLAWRGIDPDSPKLDPDSPEYDESYFEAWRGASEDWMNGDKITTPPACPECGHIFTETELCESCHGGGFSYPLAYDEWGRAWSCSGCDGRLGSCPVCLSEA